MNQVGIVSSTKTQKARLIQPSEYQQVWRNYDANLGTLQRFLTGKADAQQARYEAQKVGS